ncbi:hypothetical protein [Kitasatospora sp. MAP5-34]|uniref:hypothetical protein n=1 Tax=Kitasatospora sp. MAP5-34 TaxID=3035102 RepID=UPI002475F076|nr:hypothetical protein [Kitasatospora sp. MAP5-34]MDH6577899.1 hypothetical protein [Kitasatospora sp. MAP5-34]
MKRNGPLSKVLGLSMAGLVFIALMLIPAGMLALGLDLLYGPTVPCGAHDMHPHDTCEVTPRFGKTFTRDFDQQRSNYAGWGWIATVSGGAILLVGVVGGGVAVVGGLRGLRTRFGARRQLAVERGWRFHDSTTLDMGARADGSRARVHADGCLVFSTDGLRCVIHDGSNAPNRPTRVTVWQTTLERSYPYLWLTRTDHDAGPAAKKLTTVPVDEEFDRRYTVVAADPAVVPALLTPELTGYLMAHHDVGTLTLNGRRLMQFRAAVPDKNTAALLTGLDDLLAVARLLAAVPADAAEPAE